MGLKKKIIRVKNPYRKEAKLYDDISSDSYKQGKYRGWLEHRMKRPASYGKRAFGKDWGNFIFEDYMEYVDRNLKLKGYYDYDSLNFTDYVKGYASTAYIYY